MKLLSKTHLLIVTLVLAGIGIPLSVYTLQQQQDMRQHAAGVGTVYYVSPSGNDSNPGTESAPWKTMRRAAEAMRTAGDTAIFENGVYNESRIAYPAYNGTENAPITFKARNKHQAKLVYNLTHPDEIDNSPIRIYGINNTIQDLEITQLTRGTTSKNILIVCVLNADNCKILGNKLHNAGEECIKAYGNDPTRPVSDWGISGVLIDGNICYDTGGDGIDLVDVANSVVRNNEIYNIGQRRFGAGLMLKGGIRNVQAYNNYIHQPSGQRGVATAIQLGGFTGKEYTYDPNGFECYNSVAYNNIIYSEIPGSIDAGLAMFGMKDCAYVNNVVVGARYGMYTDRGGDTRVESPNPWAPRTVNPTFKNNIILDSTIAATRFVEIDSGLVNDYNLYFNSPNAPVETHGIYSDPKFVNKTSDWRLQSNSPAIGRAQTLTPLPIFIGDRTPPSSPINTSVDKDGKTRSTPWDIGAFEKSNPISNTPTPTVTRAPSATPIPSQTPTPTPTRIPSPTPLPTNTPIPTAFPTPNSTKLNIELTLHGIGTGGDNANPLSKGNMAPIRQQRAVSIELYDAKNVLVKTASGLVLFKTETGGFIGTVDAGTNVPSGNYLVKIKSPSYLRRQIGGITAITSSQTMSLPQTTLITGDANNDNSLNILDYNLVLDCYSELAPARNCTPDKHSMTDFTDDGSVDTNDYNLFLRELSVWNGD